MSTASPSVPDFPSVPASASGPDADLGPARRRRWGAVALALDGLMFLLYPVLRPWHDETTLAGASASMGSGAWVASHAFAMIGFVLVPLGLLALRAALGGTRGAGPAGAALVVTWIGAGLTLPYYGAEDFALHEIARARITAGAGGPDLLGFAEAVRFNPVAMTMFGAGLVLLGVGAVLAAIAVARSGKLPRFSGVPFAVGFALWLPQFYTPAAVRIGHGVLVAAGLVWLAVVLGTAAGRRRDVADARRDTEFAR
jgi:hypothetical protein